MNTLNKADVLIEAICEEVSSNYWMDSEYAEYIMDNCGGDRMICNGDTLIEAMEDNYLLEEFAESLIDKIREGKLSVPHSLAML